MTLAQRMAAIRTAIRPARETEPRDPAGEPSCLIVDRGNFTHGECLDCGWQGPGRRSRGAARRDAGLHSLAGCGITPSDEVA